MARRYRQALDEATALTNISYACLLLERFDEAIDWSNASDVVASKLQAEAILLNNLGNRGWAFYKLGDYEKSLKLYQEAELRAVAIGDNYDAILWLTTAGTLYQVERDLGHATESFQDALMLAKEINSKESIVDTLEDLAHVAIESGQLDTADKYLKQVNPLIVVNNNRLDALDVSLAQGKLAAARHDTDRAEAYYKSVENDPAAQTSMRLGAQHELARLYEQEGQIAISDEMYRTALTTFESEREQLKQEESKLPFLANATGIYDDYIHFLIGQGKVDEALAVADQSRALTLSQGMTPQGLTAQGLGRDSVKRSLRASGIDARSIAKKADATLLFYWLGKKQSYLWAVTAHKIALSTLPGQGEITAMVDRYRKSLIGPEDPLLTASQSSRDLYSILVGPAAGSIDTAKPVMILADGELSQLNFETLIVPRDEKKSVPHYWIEDVTLEAAPSLAMLAAAKAPAESDGELLMLGNAVLADENYPELPQAEREMQQIAKHFAAKEATVFDRQWANPSNYFASDPGRYAYIHFVAHGVASRTDPLDSAIILSQTSASQESFKLYARDIMQHPIDARLVTISACYGSGTRAYAGEGLVGLSWAFLRAGAHNAIGAMWAASDDSTPIVMDALYQGIRQGEPPATALREAKLRLLHSKSVYRKPFYWAPFQIYTRL